MSNPWPERKVFGAEKIGDTVRCESDSTYLIRMVQQLFVEMAELRTLVAKQMTPIYHMNVPENPYQIDPDLMSNHGEKP